MKELLISLGKTGYLLWRVLGTLRYTWRDRKRVLYQLAHIGYDSIPLVMLVGLFAGAIIAWQAAYQMDGMVSLTILGGQVARVVFMEMAPVLVAMVIAGRVGASMAAELGSMVVGEQISALRTLAIDPVRYLVLPRLLGLALMMPVLNIFAIVVALFGAFAVSTYFLDLSYQIFFQSVQNYFEPGDIWGGMIKSFIFGISIALIGCYKGLYTKGGAKGVGRSTISAFVYAAIFILLADFMLWVVLFGMNSSS
ncbi:MAG: MlaE family ABC transporter permease [Bacteroidia bacterium]